MVWIKSGSNPPIQLEHDLHVTMAVLKDVYTDSNVVLRVHKEHDSYRLCNLGGEHGIMQMPLNLKFSKGTTVSFSLDDPVSHVDLTGYYIPDEKVPCCCCCKSSRVKNHGEAENIFKAEEISKPEWYMGGP